MTNHEQNPLKNIFPGAEELINTLFGGLTAPVVPFTITPRYKQTDEYVEYKFPLPGVAQENIVPIAKESSLHVSVKDSETGKERVVYRVLLKPGLNHEAAVAECKDGLLTIQIPFSENRGGVKVGFGKLYTEEEKSSSEENTSTL